MKLTGVIGVIVAAILALDGVNGQAECDSLQSSYVQKHNACKATQVSPLNATLYCAQTACQESLQLYNNLLSASCVLNASDLPALGLAASPYLSPLFCVAECVDAFTQMQTAQTQCQQSTGTVKTTAECQGCQNYFRTLPTLLSNCKYNSTLQVMKEIVNKDQLQCDTSAKASTDTRTGSSSVSPFVICGVGGGIIVLALIVILQNRRKRFLDVFQTMTLRHKGKKVPAAGSKKAPYQAYEIPNDVRYDPEMAKFWHPQNKLSQITLRSKGGFGMVFSATLDTGGSQGKIRVALKQLLPSRTHDVEQIEQFMNEIRLAAQLDHPNIVPFVGMTWSTLQDLSMITAYMANGDLFKLLRAEHKKPTAKRSLSWSVANACNKLSIAANVLDAIAYLHGCNPSVIHRDLKSKNVLLDDNFRAHVTDFGVSRESAMGVDAIMTARVGTSAWIAPEVLRREKYTHQADMYSFGVLLSELDTLQDPYKDVTLQPELAGMKSGKLAARVAQGKITPAFSPDVPSYILSIAQRCLAYDFNQRPSAMQVAMEMNSFLIQDHQRISHSPPPASIHGSSDNAYAAL
ncbi:unnamed protein product [Aphanomyces euteiches]